MMDGAARAALLKEMERRLSQEFTPEEGVTLTWRAAIDRQAMQIREIITGLRERYVPLEAPK
jgi:hypothetical protein